MKTFRIHAVALATLATLAPAAHALDTKRIDAAIDDAIARYGLPGIAVGVVDDGEIVYTRTSGELVAGSGRPVTRRTLFKIASNTKSMTAATLARLVDAGKLDWNDKVVEHLPHFRMHDPWVTREIEVRDLLIHNSGLRAGAGDLMLWPEPNDYTRADVLRGLAHLKPVRSFRSGYDYDNNLYIVAGEVAAAAGGAPYDELVAREVFAPLGMSGCRVGEWRPGPANEVAQPHMRDEDRNVPIRVDGEVVRATTMDAAGGIRCSLDDMLRWMRAWIAPDTAARAWLSDAQRAAPWTPHTPMPVSARMRAWNDTHFYAYGYGWRLQDIDGEHSVSHTGTLAGMYSLTHLLPDRKSGFVVMMNGDADDARTVLNQVLVKQWTDPDGAPTVAAVADALARERTNATAASPPPDTSDRTRVAPDALGAALGTYHDPWLGEATLCAHEGGVRFAVRKSPSLAGTVMRTRDRYLVDWDDPTVDTEAWLDLAPAQGDKAAGFTMAKVDRDADFSSDYEDLAFTRLRGCDSPATTPAEAGLVDVATLVPDINLDIRYAGTSNFLGARVDGYDAPRCWLKREAAEALAKVERALRRDRLRLRIHDCYRPVRAVRHFVRWAEDLDDQRTKAEYYPAVDKSALMPDYISPSSGHSRGATVDLALLECDRRGCEALDMGTTWDFFDPRAHTDAPGLAKAQRRHRDRLRAAMAAAGFRNYPLEWWHYTFQPEPSPDTSYDVPIR